MAGINGGRVLAGGLVAGLVFNVGETLLNAVVIAEPMRAIGQAHALREPTMRDVGVFLLFGFVLGVVMVWLYAAARPRLGPGPKTAATIGAALWIPTCLMPVVGWVIFGLLTAKLAALVGTWGLVEQVLAAVAGAWIYKEA